MISAAWRSRFGDGPIVAVLEPLIALLVILAPLALAGVLVEWAARRRSSSHPKAAPTASAQCKTVSLLGDSCVESITSLQGITIAERKAQVASQAFSLDSNI